MPTDDKFIQDLVSAYDVDNKNFGAQALEAFNAHFAAKPKSTSKKDPNRLGSRSTVMCRLRKALLDKAGPFEEPGQDLFNSLSVEEQYKFQLRSKLANKNNWCWDLDIVP